jgi:hypothetical protein
MKGSHNGGSAMMESSGKFVENLGKATARPGQSLSRSSGLVFEDLFVTELQAAYLCSKDFHQDAT